MESIFDRPPPTCPHGNTCAGDCATCRDLFAATRPPLTLAALQEGTALLGVRGVPTQPERNGAGIETSRLHASTGRPKGARNLHAKHPSAISRAFRKAGLDWQTDFALAIKAANDRALPPASRALARQRIALWLKLLPYLITQTNHSTSVKRWKGKASRAALIALEALEGKQ